MGHFRVVSYALPALLFSVGESADVEGFSPAPDCKTFVADHPGAFANAYWVIKSLKVWSS